MKLTDPIADLFTRLRNSLQARHDEVVIPYSKMKMSILKILVDEGFLSQSDMIEEENNKRSIKVRLKYNADGKPTMQKIERVSRPGKRIYVKKSEVPKVHSGFGICILSTHKGILDGRSARLSNVGGELMGIIY